MTRTEKGPSTESIHWNGWPEIFGLNSRLGQLFNDRWHLHADEFSPGGELEETDDTFILELDLPGVTKDDITIDVTGRRVSVHGDRTEKERTGVLRHSTRTTGSFAYEFSLPTPVDDSAVTAALNDGVLTIRMPKASGAKTTRVSIA